MAYQCKCGNKEEFLEVYDTAADLVDGNGDFIETQERNVAFYICRECYHEIGYIEFQNMAFQTSAG